MAEFLIVGGGVYGVACAWHLARAGADVVVLERKAVASGASGGPGRRGVRANARDIRELPLMAAAYPVWEAIADTLGAPGLYERTGHLMLIEREQDLAGGRAQAMVQNRLGIETRFLDAAELRDFEPEVHPGILGAVYCPNDGVCEHARTTHAFAAVARQAGAVIEEGADVRRVVHDGGRATGVELADGRFVAASRGVLLLSNWSVGDLLGDQADLPVWSDAFQVLVSRPLASVPVRHLVGHASRTLSLKAENGNRVMISGGHRGDYDRATHVGTARPAAIAANVADAVATYPALAGIQIECADAGHLESVSIDQVPVIDRLPGYENLWFATGWCGHGWAIAPVVAELIVRLVVEGDCPDLLRPFAITRFG